MYVVHTLYTLVAFDLWPHFTFNLEMDHDEKYFTSERDKEAKRKSLFDEQFERRDEKTEAK